MDGDEIIPILQFIYDNINSFKKWESFVAIPFQSNDNYNQLNSFFEDFPHIPLTTTNGDCINFTSLIHALVSLYKNQTILISISPLSYFEDNMIGLKITIGSKYNKITIDKIKIILSAITNHDITVSDSQSQSYEGIIKVENGNELLVFSFDFDTFTINGYSSTLQDNNDSYSISFLAKSNFFDEFYSIVKQLMVQMIYYPSESINISLGSNSILLNIPKTQSRFIDFAEYLFPQSAKHIYSHTERSDELNAISNVTLIYFVVPTNTAPTANKMIQDKITKDSQQSQANDNDQVDSIFMFFTFINGIPQESNCHMSLEILSSITWSDLSISFIPMPIYNENESKKPLDDDFITNLNNARQMPYCTLSSIVDKPRTVIIAFLNTTKESAQALSRIALVRSFEKIQNLYPKKKSYVRLNRIWESIDTISSSLSSICDDESLYSETWNGCCSVLSQYSKKLKIAQKIQEKEETDNEYEENKFMDHDSETEIINHENDENHIIDQDIEETEIVDLNDENEMEDQDSEAEIIDHEYNENHIIDLDDEKEMEDQDSETEIIHHENDENHIIDLDYEDEMEDQDSEKELIHHENNENHIIDLDDEKEIKDQDSEGQMINHENDKNHIINQDIEEAEIIDLNDEKEIEDQDNERKMINHENDENRMIDQDIEETEIIILNDEKGKTISVPDQDNEAEIVYQDNSEDDKNYQDNKDTQLFDQINEFEMTNQNKKVAYLENSEETQMVDLVDREMISQKNDENAIDDLNAETKETNGSKEINDQEKNEQACLLFF